MPPENENKLLTWPNWPLKLRTSSSHEEGAERDFAVMTAKFEGENGAVTGLDCVRVDDKMQADRGHGVRRSRPISCCWRWASSRPVKEGCSSELGVTLDARGNVAADTQRYSVLASTRSSPAATCAAASRSSCGRSARAGNARPRSIRR